MRQSKKLSAIEAVVNTSIGYIIANLTWVFIVNPTMFSGEVGIQKSLIVNAIFTAVSVLRSYMIRRFFATSVHDWVDRTFRN